MMLTFEATLKYLSLLSVCVFLSACGCENGPEEDVVISGETFTLEVVSTEAAIERGMGGRKSLARDAGMLFVFPEARSRRFWMKNCLISLDIMFLDARGRITAIHQMPAEPLQTENGEPLRLRRSTSGLSEPSGGSICDRASIRANRGAGPGNWTENRVAVRLPQDTASVTR